MSYAKLRGRIKEFFGTEKAFAEAMGMCRAAISNRLNGKTPWHTDDICKAKELLQIADEEIALYFFTPKVHIL